MPTRPAWQGLRAVERSGPSLLAVLTLLLSLATYFLIARSRKLNKARSDLETSNASLAQANATLSVLNRQISLGARVKEKYIVNFLQGLSSQISVIRAEDNRFRNLLKQISTKPLTILSWPYIRIL